MSWCKNCNEKIIWDKQNGRYVPLGGDPRRKDYGLDHRNFCVPNQAVIDKRKANIKEDPVQIDENTFI